MDIIQFSKLPNDILKVIANKCTHNERQILRQVNKFFHSYIPYEKYKLYEYLPSEIFKKLYIDNARNIYASKEYRLFIDLINSGNLDNMKWLKDNNFQWDANTFIAAAKNGNLDNMKWLWDKGCDWNEYTFTMAAKTGNLENMRWLHENGCPWDENTFYEAARSIINENKSLENIKWLKENGCPWDKSTFVGAANSLNFKIMKWLKMNGCPYDEKTYTYFFKDK